MSPKYIEYYAKCAIKLLGILSISVLSSNKKGNARIVLVSLRRSIIIPLDSYDES